jgi:peptidoglycan/xylan/chitin deacetylase (PgdA/CDA1 family)
LSRATAAAQAGGRGNCFNGSRPAGLTEIGIHGYSHENLIAMTRDQEMAGSTNASIW